MFDHLGRGGEVAMHRLLGCVQLIVRNDLWDDAPAVRVPALLEFGREEGACHPGNANRETPAGQVSLGPGKQDQGGTECQEEAEGHA
jgi:hypothetical protein